MTKLKQAKWYKVKKTIVNGDEQVVFECELCPRSCNIKPNHRGLCNTRLATKTNLIIPEHGYLSSIAIDPIEKKPLYHFYPSSYILSIGTVGCNLTCKFCQNYHISCSQNLSYLKFYLNYEEIPNLLKQVNCNSIAFTYNEPIIFAEYVIDSARVCKENGFNTVVISNGYISDNAREDFFKYIDAANIDLKAINNNFYKNLCSANIQPVLETLIYLKKYTNVYLEITNLVIEGYNDTDNDISLLCEWILENLGPDVPLHFSAFFPAYKMINHPRTSLETLKKSYNIAKKLGLKFIYLGNVLSNIGQNTICPTCNALLIERNRKNIEIKNLSQGKCTKCHTPVPGKFSN